MPHNPLREERQHRRIQELLPWYVNGTLTAEERQAVEAHATTCARCHGELTAAAEMARAIRETGEVAPSPHPVQLSRLFARIDAHLASGVDADVDAANAVDAANTANTANIAAHPTDTADGDGGRKPVSFRPRFAARFDFTPRRMRRLLTAELAAILALASILGWHLHTPAAPAPGGGAAPAAPAAPAEYHTLSSDAPVAVAPGTVPLRVLFTEGATAARIQQLLAGIRGQITAGPSPVGAYVVAVPVGPGDDPVDLVLAHLRAQPEVSFAERVAGSGAP